MHASPVPSTRHQVKRNLKKMIVDHRQQERPPLGNAQSQFLGLQSTLVRP